MFAKQIPFDSQNANWTGKRDLDRMFLRMQQQYINDIIEVRGYIYLNQIYEMIGYPWNPDDNNVCFKRKVVDKPPFVCLSALYQPDGTLSAVDIICHF